MARQNISKNLRHARTDKVMFGDVVYEPGSFFGPRIQRDFQLVILEEGSVVVQIDQKKLTIETGEVGLLLPGGHEHITFASDRKSHHTWCALSVDLVDADLAKRCDSSCRVLPVSRRLAQLMEMGLSLPRTAQSVSPRLAESLGMTLLQEFLFSGQRQNSPHADEPDAIRRVIEYVALSYPEQVDLPSLARTGQVSPAQLVKLFQRHLGTTPMRYVWEARTRRGAQLLRETGLTVGEVAYRCGFQTPFHFSRWVKQLYQVAPRELRAQAWKQE